MNASQFFISILLILYPYFSYSQQHNIDQLIINADHLEKDVEKNLIHLKGNVHVIYKKYDILADKIKIDRNSKTIEAKGHVVLTSLDSQIISEKVIINYEDDTGTIENGFLQMGQILFTGKLFKKDKTDTYEIYGGSYTSCTTCPPTWKFTGSHIKAKNRGHIIIKNVSFKLGEIPIFWVPFLAIPSNTKRHTGFLFPSFGYGGDDGFIISESFFWAITPHQDTTWTLKNYSQRGLKGLLNYRYLLSQKNQGELNISYLKDKIYNPEEFNIFKEKQRWHIDYNHHYELPNNINHNVSVNVNSDTLYPLDFPKEAEGWGDPALENKISFSKNFENMFINAEGIYFSNFLKGLDYSDFPDEVHKLPEITYSIMPQRIGRSPLRWEFDFKYTNFLRSKSPYDDRNNIGAWIPQDGVFNPETDLLRTGQRLDFLPSLSIPFQIGPYIEIYPKMTYRETRYHFNAGDDRSVEQRFLRTDTSIRTRLSKIYGKENNTRYRHEIEPEITHTSLPWVKRPSHPFFPKEDFEGFFRPSSAITDSDLIQFDYHDRLTEKNMLTFSLTNRLIKKEWIDDVPFYKEITSLKIWQSFDYYESVSKNPLRQPWSELSALLDIRLPYLETNTLFSYFPYYKTTSLASRIKGMDSKGNYLQFTYSRSFTIDSDNTTIIQKNITEDLGVNLGIVTKYARLISGSVYSLSHQKWNLYESRLDLYPPGDCWVISFGLQNREPEDIKKLNYTFNISFLFNDKTKNLF